MGKYTSAEIELLGGCANKSEFVARYFKKFGEPTVQADLIKVLDKVGRMWDAKAALLKALPARKAREEGERRTVMIPRELTHKKTESPVKPFADDEIAVKIHNLLAELVQLQKEQLILFQALAAKNKLTKEESDDKT
jgi:hypothetical protein